MEDNKSMEESTVKESTAAENAGTAGSSKKQKKGGIIAGIIIVLLLTGILIWALTTEAFTDTGRIKIDGKWYAFSEEMGIENIQEVENGIYRGGSGMLEYQALGSSEWEELSPLSADPKVVVNGYNVDLLVHEYGIAKYGFVIYCEYETADGITSYSTEEDLREAGYWNDGYRSYNGMQYYQFYAGNEVLDWEAMEADMALLEEEGDFDCLDYKDYVEIGPDYWSIMFRNGISGTKSYEEVMEYLESWEETMGDPYNNLMTGLAFSKLCYMLEEGEIPYFIVNTAHPSKDNNLLILEMYVKEENAADWYNNWGIEW